MKKILVTGANGQLGNEMRLLAEEHKNFEYFFTDVAETGHLRRAGSNGFSFSTHQIDVIVNCAAYTAVDKAEDNVELCDKLNHVAPGYLPRQHRAVTAGWCRCLRIMCSTAQHIFLIRKKIHRVRIPYMALPSWLVSRKR